MDRSKVSGSCAYLNKVKCKRIKYIGTILEILLIYRQINMGKLFIIIFSLKKNK